jgi:DNA polymerase-1
MPGAGNANSPTYMFVGVAPGKEDDENRIPYTGKTGKQLKQLLAEAGISLRDCYFTNCLKCCLFGAKPKQSQWKGCKHHFWKEVDRVKPTVIVAVGAQAVSWLTGHTGVNKLRRKLLPLDEDSRYLVYPFRQPAMLFHQHEARDIRAMRASMVGDLRYLKDLVQRRQIHRKSDVDVDYKIAMTPEDVDQFFDEMEYYSELAFDFETTSLRKPQEHDRLVAAGFSFGQGVGRAIPLHARGMTSLWWWEDDYLKQLLLRLKDFMQRKKLWGHNAIQYDQKWSRAKLDIDRLDLITDTQYLSYVLDEEGSHKLETLALVHTDMDPWKSTFNIDDTLGLCRYLCKDVDATYRLRGVLEPQLNDMQRWLLNELILPLSRELMEVEWEGVQVNEQGLDDLSEYVNRRIKEEYEQLRLNPQVRSFEIQYARPFNVDAHDDVRRMLQTYLKLPQVKETEGGLYSTDKEVLEYYKDVPVVSGITSIRQLTKLCGTYVEGIRERLLQGKIHTNYGVHLTVTGRLASSDPNLQNLPTGDTAGKVLEDANAIKKIFSARDGYVLLHADYSQAELRTLASCSLDPALIDIYNRNLDAHTATAAMVYGIDLEQVTKGQRRNAKTVNFGIVYGMSWEGLLKKFVAAGNTEEQAKAFYDGHKRTFRKVWAWLDRQEQIIRQTGEQTTFFGRKRRYSEIDNHAVRQAYNFPVQSLASDLTQLSLVRCAKALRQRQLPARVCLTVHDSIIFEVKMEAFWETATLVHSIMSGIHFDWMRVPMAVDMDVGLNWGSLKSLDMVNLQIAA